MSPANGTEGTAGETGHTGCGPVDGSLPLAELHVHLEGTVPPALIRTLAERNGLKVPEGVWGRRLPVGLSGSS